MCLAGFGRPDDGTETLSRRAGQLQTRRDGDLRGWIGAKQGSQPA